MKELDEFKLRRIIDTENKRLGHLNRKKEKERYILNNNPQVLQVYLAGFREYEDVI